MIVPASKRSDAVPKPALPASLDYAKINVKTRTNLFGVYDDSPGLTHVIGAVTLRDYCRSFDEEAEPLASIEGIGLSVTDEDEPEITILCVEALVVDLYRVGDVLETIDAISQELACYLCLFDPDDNGELHPDLDDMLRGAIGRHVVILERARIAPAWRGLGGVGRYLVGRMLPHICCDPAVVATQPFPIDVPRDSEHRVVDKAALKRGLVKVRRTWKSIGFVPYKNDIWIMDPKLVTLERALKRIERRLGLQKS